MGRIAALTRNPAMIALVARDPSEATRYLADARMIYDRLQRGGWFQHDVRFVQIAAALSQLAARTDRAPKP